MTRTLSDLLAVLPRQRILVLGDVILDEYIIGRSPRISAEAPVPVVRFSGSRAVLGGAANTAHNVAALGGQVTLIGLVNDRDDAGRAVRDLCGDAGIRLLGVSDARSTTRKVRVMSNRQQIVRLDYERDDDIDEATAAQAFTIFDREVANADVVVLSDYAKGLLTRSLAQRIHKYRRRIEHRFATGWRRWGRVSL